MEADFSGYATKNGLKCSDGRTILADAFAHNNGLTVPLVWQHQHSEPVNILGHAILENRKDGVYAYGFFNDSPSGDNAKTLVKHKDITALSIYATGLTQQGQNVIHGDIRELSLVLSGANPGAFIDNINMMHGDIVEVVDDEAIIYTGLELEHEDTQGAPVVDLNPEEVYNSLTEDQQSVVNYMLAEAIATDEASLSTSEDSLSQADPAMTGATEKTVKDIFDTMNDEQKNVLYYMVAEAAKGATDVVQHDDEDTDVVTGEETNDGEKIDDVEKVNAIEHAAVPVADINDLPDSDFAYIEPGGKKDKDGKTFPRSLRHFPIMDEAHVRNALARAPQALFPFGIKALPKIKEAAAKFGISVNGAPVVKHEDAPEVLIHDNKEGTDMTRNVFEQNGHTTAPRPTLSHSQIQTIVDDAQKIGSLKESFLAHAVEYGIEDIDILFPDAQSVRPEPDVISRRQEWVQAVIGGAKHSPFSRIKSTAVDLTADEARAKGYAKATLKKEEIISLLKRVTTPTTVYKKQKLDRDDIIDITDLDVVAWLKAEMRVMLDEELGRAILIGDGRDVEASDKINEEHIRPIAFDDPMYAHQVLVASNITGDAIIEAILRARTFYKGTGTPSLYTTDSILTDLILLKDKVGRRLYMTEVELAAALRVDQIIVVEVMEDEPDLLGIVVNIADYTIGADKGGVISMFDDFDIDYNQYKYLLETRISGALTKPKSAVIIKRTSGTVVVPLVPAYVPLTHTITIPSVTGVEYYIGEDLKSPGAVVITETTEVDAVPATGYAFGHNIDTDWTYTYTA